MDGVRRRSQSLLALSGSAQDVKADVQTMASIPLPLSEKCLHLGAETMLRENSASSTRQEVLESLSRLVKALSILEKYGCNLSSPERPRYWRSVKHNNPVSKTTVDAIKVFAEALLKTLELMSKLRQHVKDMETCFYRILQDQRSVTPLFLARTSHHRERVQTGLSLLFEAAPLPDFPSLVLGESIAAKYGYCQREAELSVKLVAVQEVPPSSILDSSSGSCRSVHSLAEKIQNSLELQEHVKDSHMSEIITDGQKLSAFVSKENLLQDFLEAKALALSQADRLIAQYCFQRAQAEAEPCKLGSLLKETERRHEDLQSELSNQVLEVERSKADMKELLQHNSRLQQESKEHQDLKGAYNSLLSRSEAHSRL